MLPSIAVLFLLFLVMSYMQYSISWRTGPTALFPRLRNLKMSDTPGDKNDDTSQGRREIIAASESPNSPTIPKKSGDFMDSLAQNWMHGVCKHVTAFEGTTEIKRLKMKGDYLAIGMIDGRCSIIR